MLYITNENIAALLDTGNESTAQCISADLEELYFGVGEDAYIHRSDATSFFYKIEDQSTMYRAGLNPLFVHLTPNGLTFLLDNNTFVVTEED